MGTILANRNLEKGGGHPVIVSMVQRPDACKQAINSSQLHIAAWLLNEEPQVSMMQLENDMSEDVS